MPVKTAGAAVKTLTLARGGRPMLVVASYGPGGEVTLECDTKVLGLPEDAIAANAETGDSLVRLGPGRFKLAIPRHDFRIFLIESRGPKK